MQLSHPHLAEWSIRVALVVFLFELGGSLYEHLVVDAAWPSNPALIQPGRGGIDRKVFWMPLHGIATLALPLALWASWGHAAARTWLLVALGLYLAIRVWTFAYFIPGALAFETAASVERAAARTWVMWSVLRAPLLIAATLSLWRASTWLGRIAP